MSEGVGDRRAGGLEALVEDLMARVEELHAEVSKLKSVRAASGTVTAKVPATTRTHPSEGEALDLADLAEWVEGLQVRYAAAGDWLRSCWWRHGFVVEELAALRVAWLAVYNAREPVDANAGVRWHEEAERCRERIRRTISDGPGCSAVSHKPDDPVTEDSRWIEELTALRNQPTGDLQVEPFPAHRSGQDSDPLP